MTDYEPLQFTGGRPVPPDPPGWPFRHVALYCDRVSCDLEVDADIRADTAEQALPALRAHARTLGWQAPDDGTAPDLCPVHRAAYANALLGIPDDGEPSDV